MSAAALISSGVAAGPLERDAILGWGDEDAMPVYPFRLLHRGRNRVDQFGSIIDSLHI
jgi:hypothetical protein